MHQVKCAMSHGYTTFKPTIVKVPCPLCKKVFSTRNNLIRHQKFVCKGNTGENSFLCNLCNQKFARKSTLEKHLINQVCRNKGEIKTYYACNKCNRKFRNESTRDKHMIKCKSFVESVYISNVLSGQKAHVAHVSNVPSVSSTQISHNDVTCLLCRQVFSSSELLVDHLSNSCKENRSKRYRIQMPESRSKTTFVGYGKSDGNPSTSSKNGSNTGKKKRFEMPDLDVDTSVELDEDIVPNSGVTSFTSPKQLVFRSKKKRKHQIKKDLKKKNLILCQVVSSLHVGNVAKFFLIRKNKLIIFIHSTMEFPE